MTNTNTNNSTATAVAVPVTNNNEPTIAYVVPEQATYVASEPLENANVGICRRCRRQFTRPVGVNDGQAQYYRCQECEGYRWNDIFEGSCVIC